MSIKTTHPNGTTYEFLPTYYPILWNGLRVKRMVRKEGAVLITYPCGTKRFISNSWYE